MESKSRISAGLLVYRQRAGTLEVLLVHPGGPFFARKDAGAWSIPKGEFGPEEEDLAAAQREFTEETGFIAVGPFLALGEVRQKGGKIVRAWACAGDFDAAHARSNTFKLEWPPKSGRFQTFPEVDRAEYFALDAARDKIKAAQAEFLDRLADALALGKGGHS